MHGGRSSPAAHLQPASYPAHGGAAAMPVFLFLIARSCHVRRRGSRGGCAAGAATCNQGNRRVRQPHIIIVADAVCQCTIGGAMFTGDKAVQLHAAFPQCTAASSRLLALQQQTRGRTSRRPRPRWHARTPELLVSCALLHGWHTRAWWQLGCKHRACGFRKPKMARL